MQDPNEKNQGAISQDDLAKKFEKAKLINEVKLQAANALIVIILDDSLFMCSYPWQLFNHLIK